MLLKDWGSGSVISTAAVCAPLDLLVGAARRALELVAGAKAELDGSRLETGWGGILGLRRDRP